MYARWNDVKDALCTCGRNSSGLASCIEYGAIEFTRETLTCSVRKAMGNAS
jgi:hypothetical protein